MVNSSTFENAYALIVGISKYKDPNIRELKFTRADAEGIFELLTDPKIAGFNKQNIKVLLDKDATRYNIENAISSWLFKTANEESVVFIYFAGHGGTEEDRMGVEKDKLSKYLIPYDTVLEDLFSSAISNRKFDELLLSIKSKKLVIFMDTCYSGGISEGKSRDLKITDNPYLKLGEGEGRIVIAASQPDQRSFEDESIGHGVFTYNLLEALSGKADKNNVGYVTVLDAFSYLQEEVPKDAMKLARCKQEPLMVGKITRPIILSVNRDRRKLAILKELYDAENISAKMYDRLRKVIQSEMQNLPDKDKYLAKLFNDFYSEDICQETFQESLKDYGQIEPKPEQPDLEIRGIIIIQDTNGPLNDVNITFKIDNEIRKVVSDKDGSFSFNISRQYLERLIEYEASKGGYETVKGKFQLKDSRDKTQIELKPVKEKKMGFSISSIPRTGKIAIILLVLIVLALLALPSSQAPPKLSVSDPLHLNFGNLLADDSTYKTFSISNTGNGTLVWNIKTDEPWVTINPINGNNSGNDPGMVNIEINTTGLQPGAHMGNIIIESNGGNKAGTISINIPPPREKYTNSIGMIFVKLPAGAFDMGSPSDEPDRNYWEGPVHNVELANDFYMGQYEVTQKQWFDIMGYNPSTTRDDDLPVVMVSWDDTQKYIKLLNEKEKTTKYRLPTEAEWEYSARAGITKNYSFGENISKLGEYAWFIENSGGMPHSIGSRKPNMWELYDIHGNVYEWVEDWWHDDYDDAPIDGTAWTGNNATEKVVRGSSWNSNSLQSRLAFRFHAKQDVREPDLGFRIVKDM